MESEEIVEPNQTSTIELFWEIVVWLKVDNCFRKKGPSWMFDFVPNASQGIIGNISVQSFLLLDKCICICHVEKIYFE